MKCQKRIAGLLLGLAFLYAGPAAAIVTEIEYLPRNFAPVPAKELPPPNVRPVAAKELPPPNVTPVPAREILYADASVPPRPEKALEPVVSAPPALEVRHPTGTSMAEDISQPEPVFVPRTVAETNPAVY